MTDISVCPQVAGQYQRFNLLFIVMDLVGRWDNNDLNYMVLRVSMFIQTSSDFEHSATLTESNGLKHPLSSSFTQNKEKNGILALAIKGSPHFCVASLLAYLL